MTSSINPTNIDGSYPVPGVDQSSQGFRTNFTNTASNFAAAAAEITDLQNKVVLKSALSNTTLNNNMNDSVLAGAQIQDFSETVVGLGTTFGAVAINYIAGHYQTVTTSGSITLTVTGWPPAGQLGWVSVQVTVASTSHTVTLPAAATQNVVGIVGLNTSTNVMTFAQPGTYTFTFTSTDSGATIAVSESNKELQPFNGSSENLLTTAAANLAVTTSYFTTAGTATLAAGVAGQVKVFTQTAAGSMVVTVANAGWAGAGTITLGSQGTGCTLQYTAGKWYCVGNNGCTFA